jgi:arabinogalactan endo-1,4-beta-galactosidase
MDASAVPSLEAAGVKYYDFNSNEEDVFRILADNGFNYIRVRVWNDPYYTDNLGNKFGYGGGNCDLENCLAIGRRANKYGMKLLVDFQYSDFWADPGQQFLPKAWVGYTDSQIEI